MINILQQMLDRRTLVKGAAASAGVLGAANLLGSQVLGQEEAELPVDASDMETLIARAQEENAIYSYGLPDYWANLGLMWSTFMEKYGIENHEDNDLSSAQEIAKFVAEAENPIGDVGDIGIQFAPTAVQMGAVAPFKNDTWDQIPDWAKHPVGLWAVQYYGNLVMLVNTDLIENVPTSFAELLDPQYAGSVSISDPKGAAQGNYTVMAAAFANGGDEFNVQPGLDYFKELNEVGNLKLGSAPDLAGFQRGESAIGLVWDYLAIEFKRELEGQVNLTIQVPQDGSVAGPYASIINRWAPNPYAARLFRNFILSPEGQAIYAGGNATPILPGIEFPEEILADRPTAEEYASVRTINDWNQGFVAFQSISNEWGPFVLGQ
ncbi:MAG: extracellular solute-binding protein [Thermomicrobiales bacterium]|nr:extracellular solute-binding protein [Thermomicrobiales bacterium]